MKVVGKILKIEERKIFLKLVLAILIKMSAWLVFLLFLQIVILPVKCSEPAGQTTDKEFIRKQELVFQILWHTKELPNNHPEVFERARHLKLDDLATACDNQTYVKEFETRFKNGMLPRNRVSSLLYPEHLEDMKVIFNIFYHVRDFDTFITLAAWSSLVLNEVLWLNAFTMAVLHRADTKNILLPNMYEILPNYFFNNDVVVTAYRAKTGEINVVGDQFIIDANYTTPYLSNDQEHKLNYFIEDVGLNAFYYYMNNDFPFWMKSEDYGRKKHYRGEQYYFHHKQLLARFYLERLSHDLGEVEYINWDQTINPGYYPKMMHFNGVELPVRPSNSNVPSDKYQLVEEVKKFEGRIADMIDKNEIRLKGSKTSNLYSDTDDYFNDFCNAIEGNADSTDLYYYGSLDRLYKRILGFSREPIAKYTVFPSSLEIPVTSMRDPGFYRLYKKILDFGIKYKSHLPSYTQKELNFPGVRIDFVNVDNLVTYFDQFESVFNHPRVIKDVSEHDYSPQVNVKVRQQRLNHETFGYRLGVFSEKQTKAMVRIFLGPKYDLYGNELDLDETYKNYYQLDQFLFDLNPKENKIERSSLRSIFTVNDPLPGDVYYSVIQKSVKTKEPLSLATQNYGFPHRLLLPRGKKEGMPFKLLIFVSPVEATRISEVESPVWGNMIFDGKPMGYPLDRPVVPHNFDVPNAYIKDVIIYHKDGESNAAH